MKTEIKIGNKVYQVEISEPQENLLKVKVNDKEYFFAKDSLEEVNPPSVLKEEEIEIVSSGITEKEIKSPLTGTISGIYVKVGEKVKPDQKVVTIISMKMENEIVSEGYGKIKEIKVKENQTVRKGDTLIILE